MSKSVWDTDDTIVAVASPQGGALRGIVRLSGPRTIESLARIFETDAECDWRRLRTSATIDGSISIGEHNRPVSGTLYVWPGRSSYTRQPSAEFHTIGSPCLLDEITRTIRSTGVRQARPGEFTLRAFLGGRIDLTQAEAVLGVIDATDREQVDVALKQLAGGIARPLRDLRDLLIRTLAELEAGLDFVEDDIEFVSDDEIQIALKQGRSVIDEILQDIRHRRTSVDEFRVVLTGPPNVGKSRLFNAICGDAISIVASESGTTRDYLEGTIEWEGRKCRLIDTAGLDRFSATGDAASQAAQDASHTQVRDAHLRLICRDATSFDDETNRDDPRSGNLRRGDSLTAPSLVVLTKLDLQSSATSQPSQLPDDHVATSAVTGAGLDELRAKIAAHIDSVASVPSSIVSGTAERCVESLEKTLASLQSASEAVKTHSGEEIIAFELRQAIEALGEIVGAVYTDDILDRVFTQFCIGK